MHVSRAVVTLALAFLWAVFPALAQPPQKLTATLERSGALVVRVPGTQQVYATLRPGIFEAAWQYKTTSPGSQPGKARIRSRSGATIAVTVEGSLEAGADRNLHLKYTLTPDKDLSVNSAHIALLAPIDEWTKGKASLAEKEALIEEAAPKQAALVSGEGTAILTRRGVTLSGEALGQPTLIQDNRPFNTQEIEVRFGKQSPEREGRLWKAGDSETFEMVLSFPAPLTLIREEPVTLTAGEDWIPLEPASELVPGSVLDFSTLLDAPAGKYGRVTTVGGHFGFERGTKPQRFWGVNLCFTANYLEKPEADALADRLARLGYNTVRIHHYDGDATAPVNLDKLDYLVAALKKRGIYIKTDLYVSRPVPTAIALGDFKAALLVSEPAQANWREFTKNLLTHVNPFTQLAWKDEPALAWLCVVNEPNLTNSLSTLKPELFALYEKEWQTWRKGRNLPPSPLPKQVGNDRAGREVGAFLAVLHERGYTKMKAFIRELGCKALLTDLNGWSETPAFMAARNHLDFVDTHFYWDHPQFLEDDWKLPSTGAQSGASAISFAGLGPQQVAATRIFGKPFTVSEFHYVAPNSHRGEGGFLMGAAAALQDWDAVWNFAYAHRRESITTPSPVGYFDLASDPLAQASDRVAQLLFLRGDVKTAPNAVSRALRRDELLTRPELSPSPGFGDLVFVTRVGTWIEDAEGPLAPPRPSELRLTKGDSKAALSQLLQTGRLPETNRSNFDTEERQSETNEVFINGQFGSLRVVSPKTLGGLCPESDAIICGPLKIAVEGSEAAVYVSSMDGRPVTESGRLLVAHLTDLQNTNQRYAGPDRRVLEDWGTLPHLVRRGSATLTLTRKAPGKVEAWRLDSAGKRGAALPVEVNGATVTLNLSTANPDGKATIYYEVAVK